MPEATPVLTAKFDVDVAISADISVKVLEGGPSATVGVDMDGELSAEPALKVKIHLAGGR